MTKVNVRVDQLASKRVQYSKFTALITDSKDAACEARRRKPIMPVRCGALV